MKKPRLTQDQRINNAKLEGLVRYDIELYFHVKHLTDQRSRLEDMAPKIPSMKEETYSLFDKSLTEILKSVGLSRARTPIYVNWANRQDTIKDHNLIDAKDDTKDLNINVRSVYLTFGDDGKYRMDLLGRVLKICTHVFYKQLYGDLIKQTPYMKPMTDEERHSVPGRILIDPYYAAKNLAESAVRSEKSDLKEIWEPMLREYNNGEVWIGDWGGHSLSSLP